MTIIKEQQIKLDWDVKRQEILDKTNNDPEEIKKYVLNEKNTKITKKFIEDIFKFYGINYELYDIGIFHTAMTHPSYTNKDYREMKNLKSILMGINFLKGDDLKPISDEQKNMVVQLGESSYERLELVGDAILRQIISDYIFIRYKDMDEGDITKLRSQIENGSSLAEMSRRIGLHKYMLIPRNLEVNGAREKNNKFQCDIFEAFIAAIYYDSMKIKYSDIGINLDLIKKSRANSFDICFQFVSSLIEDEIDLTVLLETETNHKDELLQAYHKLGWGDPKYNLMEEIVNNEKMGKKYFKMYVRDFDGNIIGVGIGSSKQKGEKIAAKKALQHLNIIPNNNEDVILNSNSEEIYYRENNNHFKEKNLSKKSHHYKSSNNDSISDTSSDYNSSDDSANSINSANSANSYDSDDSKNISTCNKKLTIVEKIKLSHHNKNYKQENINTSNLKANNQLIRKKRTNK
jgi:ribonuclease-3